MIRVMLRSLTISSLEYELDILAWKIQWYDWHLCNFLLHHEACMSYSDDRRVMVTDNSPLSLASYNIKLVGYMAFQEAHRNSENWILRIEFSVSTDIFIWFLIWLHLFGVKVFYLSKHLSSQWIGTSVLWCKILLLFSAPFSSTKCSCLGYFEVHPPVKADDFLDFRTESFGPNVVKRRKPSMSDSSIFFFQ